MARIAKLHVSYADNQAGALGDTWVETYREGDGLRTFSAWDTEKQINVWARGIIKYFNDTLREGERARRLVKCVIEQDSARSKPDHTWHKVSLMTVFEQGRMFDRMKCETCGVTGKRFGLTNIKIDSKYRAKKYRTCGWEEKDATR